MIQISSIVITRRLESVDMKVDYHFLAVSKISSIRSLPSVLFEQNVSKIIVSKGTLDAVGCDRVLSTLIGLGIHSPGFFSQR